MNNKLCVVRAYILSYVSDGVSKWNAMGYNVLSIVLGTDGVCVLLCVGILKILTVHYTCLFNRQLCTC
jgi:hypothetical protein